MTNFSYIRVSTNEQAESGLGLLAQAQKINAYCCAIGESVDVEYVDEGHSASTLDRPALAELLSVVKRGDTVFVSRLCRLSRSVSDFAAMCERSSQDGWSLVILDPLMDLRSPAGRFTANVLASVAQFERDMISQRTKEALAVKRAAGQKLGRPSEVSESAALRISELHSSGLSMSAIAKRLESEGFHTPRGGRWSHVTVKRVLA